MGKSEFAFEPEPVFVSDSSSASFLEFETANILYNDEVITPINKAILENSSALFLYGQSKLGKSWLVKNALFKDRFSLVLDCSSFSAHLNSVEAIQSLDEFLNLHYARAIMFG